MSVNDVPVVRLGDVVDRVTKGTTPTTHGYQYTKAGVAFVRVENLRNGIIDSSTLTSFISADADRFLKRSSLEKDDVLVSIAGTIGRTAVVREQDLPANTNQAVAIIRGANKTFEPVFLRYALESPLLNRLLTGEARGGAMQNISLEDVKNVKVPVPPIDQQRRVVAEIEKQFTRLEAGVAGLRRVQANLKRYRAAILKAACEGKLVPTEAELARQEGRAYETGAQLLERILTERRQKWNARGKYKEPVSTETRDLLSIPEGWTWATLDQAFVVERGRFSIRPRNDPRYYNGPHPFVQIGDLPRDGGNVSTYSQSLNDEGMKISKKFRAGTILIAIVGATIANTGILTFDSCCPDSLVAIQSSSNVTLRLCEMYLRSIKMQLRNVSYSSGGQPNINLATLLPLTFPLSPAAEQQRIVAEVERRLSVVEEMEATVNANLQRATRLRQAILQQAFTGEL